MRVAIVHDYIKEYGGAERVLEALHEMFSDAPVFTTVYCPKFLGPHRERFEGKLGKSGGSEKWDIRTSFLQYIPFKEKLISPFRLIAPWVFKSFDFSDFDVVIVSATGAYISNSIKIRNPKSEIRNKSQNTKYKIQNTIHICYCHTPSRYLYGYMTAREWKKNIIFRVLGEIANHFLRMVDFNASQNVDYFIANSEEVRSRIKKFYRRDAVVIYPPVNINSKLKTQISKPQLKTQNLENKSEEYYLTGGRLARAKGIDVIIDAFIKSGKTLVIFGKGFGGFEEQFKVQSSKFKVNNIEFTGEVSDEEKFELMRNAKAFVFASYDEDFGITPVEAMSVGTPVIAYKSGGVKETVIDPSAGSGRATGVFYNENMSIELNKAIEKFEKLKIDPKDCINQAKKFSKENFKKEIVKFIDSHRT